MADRPAWMPSRAVIANGARRAGCVLFVAPDSYLEHETREISGRLDDLGLDDAPDGISVWEGTHAGGGYNAYQGDYNDVYPVGKFRAPTDDEGQAIREGKNPFADTPRVARTRQCTCVGQCRGPSGLAHGWECALVIGATR